MPQPSLSGAAADGGARDHGRPVHLPSLDGIRAVAFLIVFLAHAGLESVVPGGFGVTIFFFLSGYLITTLLRVEYKSTGTIGFRQFYVRRALRILPPFYLILVLSIGAARWGLVPGGVQLAPVLSQMLQFANYRIATHGYEGMPAGTGVYWSLAVEEHFYLVFPLLFALLQRGRMSGRAQARTVWLLCTIVLAWRCLLVSRLGASAERVGVATDTRVDSILFGCALAVHGNPALDGAARFSERTYKWLLLPASLALLAFSLVYRDPWFRETFRYSVQGVGLYVPMIVALRYPTWGPIRVLNTRAVAYVGVLSYCLYLCHHVLLDALDHRVPGSHMLAAASALAVAVLLAWACHELIEKPCASLRKRIAHPSIAPRREGFPERLPVAG